MNKKLIMINGYIGEIALKRDIKEEVVIENLRNAFEKAIQKKYDPEAEIELVINENDFKVFNSNKIVVSEKEFKTLIEDGIAVDLSYSTVKKSKLMGLKVKINDIVKEEINIQNYTKELERALRSILIQKNIEESKIVKYEKLKGLVGEMLTVEVKNKGRDWYTVTFEINGEIESAEIKNFNMNPALKIRSGSVLEAYVENIDLQNKGSIISLSTSHPEVVKRLLEINVPEVMSGEIEIRDIQRVSGIKTKVVVKSNNELIDPIGSIVGNAGSRIKRVVESLGGEKVELVKWDFDIGNLMLSSILPARVISYNFNEEGKRFTIIVPNIHKTLAIGKRGSNVRTSSLILSANLDILSIDEAKEKGIEIKWNGNLNPEELEKIESGEILRFGSQRFQKKPSFGAFDDEIKTFGEDIQTQDTFAFEKYEAVSKKPLIKEEEVEGFDISDDDLNKMQLDFDSELDFNSSDLNFETNLELDNDEYYLEEDDNFED
ncbi:MAG: hypothetical protein K4H23_04690 [Mollicutes bacterium PWAP]|nr:hypothetical protein [Mollicutes bacterium PWAP]